MARKKKVNSSPAQLLPEIKEKVWAGNALSRDLGIGNKAAGEAWYTSSAARIKNGPRFGEYLKKNAKAALGDTLYGKYGAYFPVLIKIIEARKNLSVQVHPDDRHAKAAGFRRGKSETWAVLSAKPGAIIYLGLKKGVTPEKLIEAARQGDPSGMVITHKVRPGDVYDVPAGAVHALGAGVRVLEIQQDSDITYRIHDWGRAGRDTHLDQALHCIKPKLGKKIKAGRTSSKAGMKVTGIAANRYYRVAKVAAERPVDYFFKNSKPAVFVVERGRLGHIRSGGKYPVFFMPASASGAVLHADAGTVFYVVEAAG